MIQQQAINNLKIFQFCPRKTTRNQYCKRLCPLSFTFLIVYINNSSATGFVRTICNTFLDNYSGTIQINYQQDATIFQFIILTFIYSSTCFGRFPTHHQELNDCSSSLWFYLRIVVTVVLC